MKKKFIAILYKQSQILRVKTKLLALAWIILTSIAYTF